MLANKSLKMRDLEDYTGFFLKKNSKAYGATLCSFGPFSALYFLTYEKLKGII
jgi:hypothetical protein